MKKLRKITSAQAKRAAAFPAQMTHSEAKTFYEKAVGHESTGERFKYVMPILEVWEEATNTYTNFNLFKETSYSHKASEQTTYRSLTQDNFHKVSVYESLKSDDYAYSQIGVDAAELEIEFVKFRLSNGMDPNTLSTMGTALHVAAQDGRIELMQILIAAGTQINSVQGMFGQTPLVMAAAKGQLKSVKFLLKNKADIEAKWGRGEENTIMAAVAQSQNLATVKFIFEQIKNKEVIIKNKNENVILFAARRSVSHASFDVIKYLIEVGFDVNQVSEKSGDSTLHYVATRGGPDSILLAEFLMSLGANPSVKNNDGKTPADVASSPEVQALILAKLLRDTMNERMKDVPPALIRKNRPVV